MTIKSNEARIEGLEESLSSLEEGMAQLLELATNPSVSVAETEAAPKVKAPKVRKPKARKQITPWKVVLDDWKPTLTKGGRVKYDSDTIQDGVAEGVQLLNYLPKKLAGSKLRVTIEVEGEALIQ